MLAMIAAIAIQYVERVDPVQIVLFKIGREHAGNAGIEAGTQQRHQAGVLEAIMICQLPMIFELRLIARFVIGRVHIMYAGLEAGFHDGKILIGQGQIDDELWLYPFRIFPSWKPRSEEHTSELQSLMRTSYAVFCLKKKKRNKYKRIKG